MPTSCSLFSVNSKYWHVFHNLFLKENVALEYARIEPENKSPVILKLYNEPKEEKDGYRCACGIDVPQYFYNRDQGRVVDKATIDFFFKIYYMNNFNLLAIFVSKSVVSALTYAFNAIAKKENPAISDFIIPLALDLGGKEKAMQTEFVDVRRFWMRDLPDIYVKTAAIGGIMLQDSPEYKRYVRGRTGRLMSISFKWRGITIILSSNGVLFTYTTFGSDLEASAFFKQIIDVLFRLGVINFVAI